MIIQSVGQNTIKYGVVRVYWMDRNLLSLMSCIFIRLCGDPFVEADSVEVPKRAPGTAHAAQSRRSDELLPHFRIVAGSLFLSNCHVLHRGPTHGGPTRRVSMPSLPIWRLNECRSPPRFVEIQSIAISNALVNSPLGKLAIVIEHDNGIQESFKVVLSGERAAADCKTYVEKP